MSETNAIIDEKLQLADYFTEALSMTQIAEKYNVTRQSVYLAIAKGKLKACQIGNVWRIMDRDYQEYRMQKYNRMRSKFNGLPLFQADKQELSCHQVAKLFGVLPQHVYYLIRSNQIPFEKRGTAIILKYEDCMKHFSQENPQQMTFA
jgi:excisionase family DNA binding protein